MLAIRTRLDGREIHLPAEAKGLPPGNVIVLFEDERHASDSDWLKIQERTMADAWDDKEDSIYDEA
jgi:hypothetical protein